MGGKAEQDVRYVRAGSCDETSNMTNLFSINVSCDGYSDRTHADAMQSEANDCRTAYIVGQAKEQFHVPNLLTNTTVLDEV